MTSATYHEIIQACPGLDPHNRAEDASWICDQLRREATIEQVRGAHTVRQQRRIQAIEREMQALDRNAQRVKRTS